MIIEATAMAIQDDIENIENIENSEDKLARLGNALRKFSCGCVKAYNGMTCDEHKDGRLAFIAPHSSNLPYIVVASINNDLHNYHSDSTFLFTLHRCKKDKYNFPEKIERLPISQGQKFPELLIPEVIELFENEDEAFAVINDLCICGDYDDVQDYFVDKLE